MSVVDKLDAARKSLGGSSTSLAVCKATSREIMGPKKKHVDYLVECTKNEQFDMVNLAELLFERCRMASWVIVSKALVTFHNLMSNGDQRFLEHMASRASFWNLENYQDKTAAAGYDMSAFIRRYSNYLAQKVRSYAEVEYDFCSAKRGPDGVLRSLDTPTLLKTLGIIETDLGTLLEVDLQSSEFSNGIINSAFVLLFKDMVKLFACYNDGMIKLLEIYSDLNKGECKESMELYKNFLSRTESVQKFFQVAQNVGIHENAIPDLAEAPSGLLQSLQDHYDSLEKGQIQTTTNEAMRELSTLSFQRCSYNLKKSTRHANLAPINIPLTSEQFNFKNEESNTATEKSENIGQPQTLLQSAQITQPGAPEDTWGTIFEPDEQKQKTTTKTTSSSSDDLLQLNSVFQAQQVQQTPVAYFPPQSGFGQTATGPNFTANQTGFRQTGRPNLVANQTSFQPAVNGLGQPQPNVWGQNVSNTDVGNTNKVSTNPFDTIADAVDGDVLQPMNKPQPQGNIEARTSTGDLHSTLNKVVNSLDDFSFSSSKTAASSQVGSGGHQWTAPKPKVKTGGANFQLGTMAGTTLSPTSPISPIGSNIPPVSPVSGMTAGPAIRPGYMQPGMYGGVQSPTYGQQPMMRPQGNVFPPKNIRPTNPFANPAPRNQALF